MYVCSIKIRKKRDSGNKEEEVRKKRKKTAANHPIFLSSHIGIIHQSKEMLRRTSKVKRRKKIEERRGELCCSLETKTD